MVSLFTQVLVIYTRTAGKEKKKTTTTTTTPKNPKNKTKKRKKNETKRKTNLPASGVDQQTALIFRLAHKDWGGPPDRLALSYFLTTKSARRTLSLSGAVVMRQNSYWYKLPVHLAVIGT